MTTDNSNHAAGESVTGGVTDFTDEQRQDLNIDSLLDAVSNESFQSWRRDREFERNIREGQWYFNGPSRIPEPERHSPSSLLQCQRKVYYRQLNAPREEPSPNGIFWFGSRFEEDIFEPYLAEITGPDEYVTNSMWVDFDTQGTTEELRIKGSTDPVIVDGDANPVLPTEVKTKRDLDNVDEPNEHHLAQLHAYMRGLSLEHDRQIRDGLIVYGGRTNLDIEVFPVTFDDEFWTETVLDWAEDQTVYRLSGHVPPANPRFDWECSVCDFKERCGQGGREIADLDATGLIPLFVYPEQQLTEYLDTYDASLTPSLACHYPELVPEYGVLDWQCRGCDTTYRWDDIEWAGDVSSPPKCPTCKSTGTARFLSGPHPDDQPVEVP